MQWRNLNRNLMKAMAMACAIALPLAACDDDDDPIAPPEPDEATMELAVADDAQPVDDEGEPIAIIPGEFQGDVQVQVFSEGAWVDVTGLQTGVSMQLGASQQVVGSTEIDPGTYNGARVVITNATVEVPEGTEIGEAEPLEEAVVVTIAEAEAVIAAFDQPVIVQEEGSVQLLLNLNSHQWMDQQAVETGAVAATTIETALQLTVQ